MEAASSTSSKPADSGLGVSTSRRDVNQTRAESPRPGRLPRVSPLYSSSGKKSVHLCLPLTSIQNSSLENRTPWAWPHLHQLCTVAFLGNTPLLHSCSQGKTWLSQCRWAPLTSGSFFSNSRPTSTWLESHFSSPPVTSHWRHHFSSSRQEGTGSLEPADPSLTHEQAPRQLSPQSQGCWTLTRRYHQHKGRVPQSPFSGEFLLRCHGRAAGLGHESPPWWEGEHHSQHTQHSSWHWVLPIF